MWCPGAPADVGDFEDAAKRYSVWQSSVDLFTSGIMAPTVVSVFDIQWRSFQAVKTVDRVPEADLPSSTYSAGYYRQISQLILEDKLLAVEGLVVDSNVGRIGFRNHTVPVDDMSTGAQWTEDLLFIEPESRCVDTNLTLDYTYNQDISRVASIVNVSLVDHGGFTFLPDRSQELDPRSFQNDAALHDRAYTAAWKQNMLIMQYFNITTNGSDGQAPFAYMNSEMGKKFPLDSVPSLYLHPLALQTSEGYAEFLSVSGKASHAKAPNPFNVTSADVIRLPSDACRYPSKDARPDISSVGVSCGLVFAAPERTDGGDPLIPDTNSTWSTHLYSCAVAAKAVIREVTFRFNGTGGLGQLTVETIEPKTYTRLSEMPLWGGGREFAER